MTEIPEAARAALRKVSAEWDQQREAQLRLDIAKEVCSAIKWCAFWFALAAMSVGSAISGNPVAGLWIGE